MYIIYSKKLKVLEPALVRSLGQDDIRTEWGSKDITTDFKLKKNNAKGLNFSHASTNRFLMIASKGWGILTHNR